MIVGIAGLIAASAPTGPVQVDWQAAARQDVRAAHDLYSANHPGMHDPGNPGFRQQLDRAREAGLEIAAKATTEAGYGDALGAFSAIISDGHARAFSNQLASAQKARRLWPGFVAAWRGRMLVQRADGDSPAPAGSQIMACDGLPAVEFVSGQIGYRGFRPAEAGQWWSRAPQAFFATEGVWPGPARCTFRLPDGAIREADLRYRPVPTDFSDMVAAATDGERTPIGLSEPRPGIFLIGMQTFGPDAEGVKAYRQMFADMAKRRSELLKARAVVIDLRHNNGGSSAWSNEGAAVLWGKAALDPLVANHFRNVRIWWRASADNSAYVSKLEAQIRGDGYSEIADGMRQIAKGMAASLAHGEPFFVEGEEATTPLKQVPTDFKAPVYVITPGRCASACLDAIDVFTLFGNVRLIGAPTSADSTYMEVRSVDLPSGHGRLVIPNKIWVGRPRPAGAVYGPHIQVTDLDWSTATFLDRIERELARR